MLSEEGGEVTKAGARFLDQFGAELNSKAAGKRIFCRACLDWSERRYHVAGWSAPRSGGAAWSWAGSPGTRQPRRAVTPAGKRGLRETFGVKLDLP